MCTPLSSASKRSQVLVTCFLTIPWVLIGIVAFGLLPEGWRFDRWPALLRGLSVFACVLYYIADLVFAAWYLLVLVTEAFGNKSD